MTEFNSDVKDRKELARGSRYRKCGAKSKKCSLPSDMLTEAQKRKLNGPCTSVKLGVPMTWGAFRKLTPSLAAEYLTDLRDTYDVTQRMLAQMFCVHYTRVGTVIADLGLSDMFPKTRTTKEKSALRQAKWDAFCNGVVGGQPAVEEFPPLLDASDIPALTEEERIEEESMYAPVDSGRMENFVRPTTPKATNLCATFEGFPDLATLESFYRLVGTDKVRVTINVEAVG